MTYHMITVNCSNWSSETQALGCQIGIHHHDRRPLCMCIRQFRLWTVSDGCGFGQFRKSVVWSQTHWTNMYQAGCNNETQQVVIHTAPNSFVLNGLWRVKNVSNPITLHWSNCGLTVRFFFTSATPELAGSQVWLYEYVVSCTPFSSAYPTMARPFCLRHNREECQNSE